MLTANGINVLFNEIEKYTFIFIEECIHSYMNLFISDIPMGFVWLETRLFQF